MTIFQYTDDRDTFIIAADGRLSTTVIEKFKVWQTRLKNELPAGSLVNHIGAGNFLIVLPVITCTGSDVETIFNIPFMHEIHKTEIKHVDAAGADSANSLDYSAEHKITANLWLKMLTVTGSTASSIVDQYVDYYHTRGEYKITTKSTNTELLYINFYIRFMGD
jgi:hypothetical protein